MMLLFGVFTEHALKVHGVTQGKNLRQVARAVVFEDPRRAFPPPLPPGDHDSADDHRGPDNHSSADDDRLSASDRRS